ncbi:MAG: hypothetical protein JWQ42_3068 [Edaphobacter sp.]|nr:hypothetical protein [Edaphobacter sp.]
MPREIADKSVYVRRPALLRGTATGPLTLWRWFAVSSLVVLHALAGYSARGQNAAVIKEGIAASPVSVDPRSWAVDASANELLALHHPGSYLRYRIHMIDDKGDRVRDLIESKDGSVARLIMRDGRPLTNEEDIAERQRLNDMLTSPSNYAKHVKNDASGRKIADTLLKLMPDAMVYTYVPGQPQTGKNPGSLEIVLDYKPNPKFSPPTTMAGALTGLQGRAWIDAKSRYVVRMEGSIFRGVNFGWGMLAHIYPGGQLVIEQTHAGGGRWIFTRFTEQLTVRALMVKTLNVKANIEASNFQTIGPMSYQDAIHLLLNTPLPQH